MKRATNRSIDPIIAGQIVGEHSRRCRGGPEGHVDIIIGDGRRLDVPYDMLAYHPISGKCAGSAAAGRPDGPGLRIDPSHFILIADNHLPSVDEVAAARIEPDGTVIGGVFRKPPPPPPVKPGPSEDPGVPLPEHVITAIIENFRKVVAAGALAPAPRDRAVSFDLAFSPVSGVYAGPTLNLGVFEHIHELVVLNDCTIPTVEHLRRVRRHENKWITWEPENEASLAS